MSADVVIVSAVRTPIGKFGQSLAKLSAIELGAIAIKEVINRACLLYTSPSPRD